MTWFVCVCCVHTYTCLQASVIEACEAADSRKVPEHESI